MADVTKLMDERAAKVIEDLKRNIRSIRQMLRADVFVFDAHREDIRQAIKELSNIDQAFSWSGLVDEVREMPRRQEAQRGEKSWHVLARKIKQWRQA